MPGKPGSPEYEEASDKVGALINRIDGDYIESKHRPKPKQAKPKQTSPKKYESIQTSNLEREGKELSKIVNSLKPGDIVLSPDYETSTWGNTRYIQSKVRKATPEEIRKYTEKHYELHSEEYMDKDGNLKNPILVEATGKVRKELIANGQDPVIPIDALSEITSIRKLNRKYKPTKRTKDWDWVSPENRGTSPQTEMLGDPRHREPWED